MRAVALLAAGSATIHQARYELGSASHGAAPHHGYLKVVIPLVIAGLVLAMAGVLLRVGRGGSARTERPLWAGWLAAATALALIFSVQESIEGASFITGSGWIGLALAIPAGLLVALALHGASAAETAPPRPPVSFTVLLDLPAAALTHVSGGRVASFSLGARAPPLASVV